MICEQTKKNSEYPKPQIEREEIYVTQCGMSIIISREFC